MKIIQISGFDTLGIQVNGYLLHKYYQDKGHDSYMYVHGKYSDDDRVRCLHNRSFFLTRINAIMAWLGIKLSLWTILPVEAFKILFIKKIRQADVVHLQLIHNAQFFSLLLIPLLTWIRGNKPTLLSIHDMFMVTGHCVYSMGCQRWKHGCGKCPHLDTPFPIKYDTTGFGWWLRRIIFALARIHLVIGSPWQQRMLQKSPILHKKTRHYIPYGIDSTEYYKKDKKHCRKRFGIPENARVISFRSCLSALGFKGTSYIISALLEYEPKVETWLLTFEDQGYLDILSAKYRIIQLPWTNDDQEMINDALNAADIFLMPSIAEAFGLMAMEALACGTPVIAFEGTALEETINAPDCGLVVPMKDAEALKEAIVQLLENHALRAEMARNGLKLAQQHRLKKYADSFLSLYQKLIAGPPET